MLKFLTGPGKFQVDFFSQSNQNRSAQKQAILVVWHNGSSSRLYQCIFYQSCRNVHLHNIPKPKYILYGYDCSLGHGRYISLDECPRDIIFFKLKKEISAPATIIIFVINCQQRLHMIIKEMK